MNHSTLRLSCAACGVFALSLCCASPVRADDLPPNDFRLGLYAIFFHGTADDLAGPYVPAGVNFKFDNTDTLYGAYIRRLTENVQVEFALGVPPLTKSEGRGPASLGSVPYAGETLTTTRWFSPTLLLEYSFFDESTPLRPFLGVGVNYTNFYDRDFTGPGSAASGGPTKLSLSSSVGPAVTGGLAWRLAPRWHVYASYSWSEVKTNLSADTAGEIRTTRISFSPQPIIVSFGYAF
jgi:outer membrane protein